MTVRAALVWLTLIVLSSTACAGHSARTQEARSALDARDPERALKLYNEELEVVSEKELPKETSGDNALLLLDRSMVLQQLEEYELASRDLQTADKQIEVLDFSRSTADEIGKYLYSDDTGPYLAPAYEKLMVNTLNMVNYLARRDLSGARVEARRLAVMQDFLKNSEGPDAALLGAGSYLAGFVFERSNEWDEAMRYYDEALQYGDFKTLHDSIVRLAARSSYRTPRLQQVLDQGTTTEGEFAEVLVVVSYGRVPAKIAKRIPVGLALTYAAGGISSQQSAQLNRMAAQGLVTWVNFPMMEKPTKSYGPVRFGLDGREQPLDLIPVADRAVETWRAHRGTLVASAITRLLARLVAGQVASKATDDKAIGFLLSLATQATLSAADTPDTRSWSTLPGQIAIGRIRVPAGTHVVKLSARGANKTESITVKPGDWSVVSFTQLH